MTRRTTRIATLLVLAGLLAAGCGDEKIVAVGGGAHTDVSNPDGGVTGDGHTVGPELLREIVVLHDTSRALSVTVTQNQPIRAKIIDYGAGGPAPDAAVRYALIPDGDPADASLSSLIAYTDEAGVATVTFRGGTVADRSYTLRISADNAADVDVPLHVADAPRGDLRVKVAYEGPIAVKNLHLMLVPGTFTCGQFSPVHPPTHAIGEKTLLGVGQGDVVWPNLPAGERFTVVATAESHKGSLAAAGCLDGIVVIGEQDNSVTLTMFLLVLNPTGHYDSTTVFDFTGAIPGQLGELVTEISTLFSSPGTFLINQVKKLAAIYVGQLITDAVFGLFEDAVADVIDDWMFNNSPQWVQDILTIGQDLFQVVNRLEMQANLLISKLTNDYFVHGALRWSGIVLTWRFGCPAEGAPDYDPECGRYTFSLEQFQNTQFPMDIVEGSFTAIIRDFDQLEIDNHTIKINYGKLIIFVLNEMVLPALTGENTLLDAILSFVNCTAIGNAIGGFSALGISSQDVADFCTSAVTIIVSPVQAVLGSLAIDSQLRMSGNATLVDEDDDLKVDLIEEGRFLGHFESDGQQGAPFHGVWDATRRVAP